MNLSRNDDGIGVVVGQRLPLFFSTHPQLNLQIIEAGTNGLRHDHIHPSQVSTHACSDSTIPDSLTGVIRIPRGNML